MTRWQTCPGTVASCYGKRVRQAVGQAGDRDRARASRGCAATGTGCHSVTCDSAAAIWRRSAKGDGCSCVSSRGADRCRCSRNCIHNLYYRSRGAARVVTIARINRHDTMTACAERICGALRLIIRQGDCGTDRCAAVTERNCTCRGTARNRSGKSNTVSCDARICRGSKRRRAAWQRGRSKILCLAACKAGIETVCG